MMAYGGSGYSDPVEIVIESVTLSLGGAGAEGEGESEGEGEGEGEPAAPPVTSGAPVAGMMGLGLAAAACALGGALTLRKK